MYITECRPLKEREACCLCKTESDGDGVQKTDGDKTGAETHRHRDEEKEFALMSTL